MRIRVEDPIDMSSPQTEQSLTASVRSFFDELSSEYDASIQRLIPQYQEIFETLVTYSFLDRQAPLRVLELGCGSGNLSLFIAHLFPNARLTLVDLSPEMLVQAKAKLSAHLNRVTFQQANFLEVDLPENGFDWTVSSFALHHLPDPEKQVVYKHIHQWLQPGGILRIADGTAILPAEHGKPYLHTTWMAAAKEAGASDEECKLWMEHTQQYDHFASLHHHFQWLHDTGFSEVDCYWKKLHLAVFGAQKPY
jgi:tRNA (cmo5U34)-methyltransferase